MLTIRNWSETFENATTRKQVRPRFMCMPTGVESNGYIELMSRGKDGMTAFGIFIAICQWSATRRPECRGLLARDGMPLADAQLATYLRVDVNTLSDAIKLLTSKEIGWLVEVESNAISQLSATNLPVATQSGFLEGSVVECKVGEGEGSGSHPPTDLEIPFQDKPGFASAWTHFVAHLAEKGNPLTDPQQAALFDQFRRDGIEKALADLRFSVKTGARKLLDSSIRFDKLERGQFVESEPTGTRPRDDELKRNLLRAGLTREMKRRNIPIESDQQIEDLIDKQLKLEATP